MDPTQQPPQGQPPGPPPEPPGPDGQPAEMPDLTSKAPDGQSLETFNLVEQIQSTNKGREWLEKQVKLALDGYSKDLEGSKGYRQRCADDMELFLGRGGTMRGAAEGEPKPCLPILAKIVLRIVARVLTMATTTEPIPVPTGDEDNDRAERVGLHISWEKRAKHPDWSSGMFATILQWCIFGSAFRWVDWDPLKNKKNIEPLSISELILPYTYKDHSLHLENVPHFTRVRRLPRHEIERRGDVGYFANTEGLFDDEGNILGKRIARAIVLTDGEPDDDPVREVMMEQEGVEADGQTKSNLFAILERHYWARLPGEKRSRRLALTFEKSSKTALRLVIMEEEDKLDRLRFENETRENGIAFENQTNEWQMQASTLAQQGGDPASLGPPPVEPEPPAPPRTEPIFPPIHYKFWENPEGIYGLGVGVFSSQLNEVANNLMGENIVAERLANLIGGIMSDDLGLEKGELQLKYGKFISVPIPRGELEGSFKSWEFQRPKGNIMSIISSLDEACQTVMSSSDYQSGMPGPSHETAAAAKLRNSEGSRAIDAAMEMFLLPLAAEYREYARLNSIFLSDVEYFHVTEPDPNNPGKQNRVRKTIGRADYATDYDMTFSSDARMSLDPGVGQSALQAYQMLLADPFGQQNPDIQLKALKKALKALKANDLAALLPDKAPPPPPPPSPMNQVDETAGMMQEQDHPVLDDDDHLDHLGKIAEFKKQGIYDEMPPTPKQMLDRHEQAHKAKAYQQAAQIQEQEGGHNGISETLQGPEAGLA